MDLLTNAEIPAMPVHSLADVLEDAHLEATQFWVTRETAVGRMRFPGIPTDFSKTPGAIGEAGPGLGEHSAALLAEFGYTPDEIKALIDSGAAGIKDKTGAA